MSLYSKAKINPFYQAHYQQKLDTLIEEAYRLFNTYQFGNVMGVCTCCCLQEEDIKTIQSTPLSKLPAEPIYQYLDSAFADIPVMVKQVKYLLPRILELLLQDAYLRHSNEIILDKCYCKSESWTAKELDFMQRFAVTFFEYQTMRQFNYYIDDYLIMFDIAELDVIPLLERWLHLLDFSEPLVNLANLIDDTFKDGKYQGNAFATKSHTEKVSTWFQNEETRAFINSKMFEELDKSQTNIKYIDLASYQY